MTKVKASELRGKSKDELTKQLNEHKQVKSHFPKQSTLQSEILSILKSKL